MKIHIDNKSFSVPKIIGVGRNYDAHIREMKARPTGEPVLFIKPATSLCDISAPLRIPHDQGAVHHELELAVLIGKGGGAVSESAAMSHVAGYGMALDLTLRDVQSVAKKKGLPWAVAKGFDGACPITPRFIDKSFVPDPHDLNLTLKVNGHVRQQGHTGQMIYTIPYLIHYISRFFTLQSGDIILTGTPAGVGPLQPGDSLQADIESIAGINTRVE
ncbi:MAG: fumarylacetoacetate hydrolase family protein [Calditrichaeota bacterium]|nr:MAG: fumarylacetoacetate hydrolase family protein [Calditrichota bacterium]